MYSQTSISVQLLKRKHAHIFAGIHAGVVKVPDFRPLIFRIPLAERIAEAEKTFLCAGFFLVAPRAADGAIELKFLNRREQRREFANWLRLISPGVGTAIPFGDCVFNFAND